MGIAKEVVGVRFGPEKKVQRDMLGSFIAHGLTQEECETQVVIQIFAGSDTSATTIRMTVLNILGNFRILSKLLAEIDALDLPLEEVISDAQAKRMPYLQAVIKEGIRYWPAVGGALRRTVPPEGETTNGYFVPGGTDIGMSPYAIQRDKSFWGEDSDVYRPERYVYTRGLFVYSITH
ncbi:benzoate 4-monooxygenase cytochrome p450 [Phlyctema vagabunda]|uniref:Benzoate 4-monooxygenase cytochrome p450 n=1 Tax=Phlyctema vagabunda TaxID=108571 RepID=A0ABR4P4A6_9HELO